MLNSTGTGLWILIAVTTLSTAACDSTGSTEPTSGEELGPTSTSTPVTAVESTSTTESAEEPEITFTTEGEGLGGRMTIEINGQTRSYLLFIPPGHNVDEPSPLVINAHGAPSNPSAQAGLSAFDEVAAEEGIVVAYPAAAAGIWDFEDGEEMDRTDVNDLDFIRALIDEVSSMVSVDSDRIYAIGFSMGAGISNLFACHMPDEIAAIVQVAGFMHYDGPACPEPKPTYVLAIVGEADPITSQGTQDLPFVDQPLPADVEAEAWATTNSCDPTPEVTELSGDITRSRYTCGADAALVVYRHPGGHTWPSRLGPDIVTNELIWEFLSQIRQTE